MRGVRVHARRIRDAPSRPHNPTGGTDKGDTCLALHC